MKNKLFCKALAVLSLWAVCGVMGAPPAQAQILGKISKGLNKVNKKLDKANQVLSGTTTPQGKGNGKAGSTSDEGATTIDERGWKAVEHTGRTPYLSPHVKFLQASKWNVTDVHENVFAIRRGSAYEFWRMDGTKLFDAKWMPSAGAQEPAFCGGVVPMKSAEPNAAGKQCICLLYLDGRVKELDPAITEATNFMDGLAIVTQRVNYRDKNFYINVRGEKVFPHLTESGLEDDIRPLHDGLRAFKAQGNWGFIDAQGKVVLPNKYYAVRDFSEGYAWVKAQRESYSVPEPSWTLIDKQGNVVFTAPENCQPKSDVNSGRFCLIQAPDLCYYDLQGNRIAAMDGGTSVYGGYAFVKQKAGGLWNIGLQVVDRDFHVVGSIDEKVFSAAGVNDGCCHFSEFGLATVTHKSVILNPRGEIVVQAYDNHHGCYAHSFGEFTACGLARVGNINLGRRSFSGIMNADGEILWLFDDTPITREEWRKLPVLPPPNDSLPRIGDEPPVIPDTLPLGPTKREEAKFSIRAQADPAEGGSVSLSATSPVAYGEYVTVSAVPNKDWAITHVTTDLEGAMPPQLGQPYTVLGDATYTVHFLKKEDDKAPTHSGCYQGSFNDVLGEFKYDVDVYAEISAKQDIATPYGEHTYGFLTVMFDPDRRYISENGEVATNMLFLPMCITGYQQDEQTGQRWLVAEGGSMTFGNLKTNPQESPLAGFYFNTIMAINGESSPSSIPRRYRIEMLDFNEQTGEFTCGMMETFSPKAGGWVNGNDPSLRETTHGFMMSKTDRGLPSGLFHGIHLRTAQKRTDVSWYPTASWYNGKADVLESIIATMKSSYSNFKSDYDELFGDK